MYFFFVILIYCLYLNVHHKLEVYSKIKLFVRLYRLKSFSRKVTLNDGPGGHFEVGAPKHVSYKAQQI